MLVYYFLNPNGAYIIYSSFLRKKKKKKKRTLDALHGHGQYARTIIFPEEPLDTYTDDISQSPANRAARENGEMAP